MLSGFFLRNAFRIFAIDKPTNTDKNLTNRELAMRAIKQIGVLFGNFFSFEFVIIFGTSSPRGLVPNYGFDNISKLKLPIPCVGVCVKLRLANGKAGEKIDISK